MRMIKVISVAALAALGAAAQETAVRDREAAVSQQKKSFERAVKQAENSSAFRAQRERFERDLARIAKPDPTAPAQDQPLAEARQRFEELEASPDVQMRWAQARQQAKETEAGTELEVQRRIFSQEMKRLETTPDSQEQKAKIQREVKAPK